MNLNVSFPVPPVRLSTAAKVRLPMLPELAPLTFQVIVALGPTRMSDPPPPLTVTGKAGIAEAVTVSLPEPVCSAGSRRCRR